MCVGPQNHPEKLPLCRFCREYFAVVCLCRATFQEKSRCQVPFKPPPLAEIAQVKSELEHNPARLWGSGVGALLLLLLLLLPLLLLLLLLPLLPQLTTTTITTTTTTTTTTSTTTTTTTTTTSTTEMFGTFGSISRDMGSPHRGQPPTAAIVQKAVAVVTKTNMKVRDPRLKPKDL